MFSERIRQHRLDMWYLTQHGIEYPHYTGLAAGGRVAVWGVEWEYLEGWEGWESGWKGRSNLDEIVHNTTWNHVTVTHTVRDGESCHVIYLSISVAVAVAMI